MASAGDKMPDQSVPQLFDKLREPPPHRQAATVSVVPNSGLMTIANQYAPAMLLARVVKRTLPGRTVRTVLDAPTVYATAGWPR